MDEYEKRNKVSASANHLGNISKKMGFLFQGQKQEKKISFSMYTYVFWTYWFKKTIQYTGSCEYVSIAHNSKKLKAN